VQIILASFCIQTDCDAPSPCSSEVVFPLAPQIMLVLQNDSAGKLVQSVELEGEMAQR